MGAFFFGKVLTVKLLSHGTLPLPPKTRKEDMGMVHSSAYIATALRFLHPAALPKTAGCQFPSPLDSLPSSHSSTTDERRTLIVTANVACLVVFAAPALGYQNFFLVTQTSHPVLASKQAVILSKSRNSAISAGTSGTQFVSAHPAKLS